MKKEFYYLWTTGRGLYLLLGLLVFGIFVSPLLITDGFISDVFIECIFALILVAGVFSMPCSVWLRIAMLLLAILAVVTRALHKFHPSNFDIVSIDNIFGAITLVAFSILIMRHFILSKCLLSHRIAAAVAIYLIIGVLFARLYEMIYLFNHQAFSLNQDINPYSLVYFSFVTLITLGFGDIVPLSIAARSLTILEGIIGQLYMVILISSLVSEFAALAMKSQRDRH